MKPYSRYLIMSALLTLGIQASYGVDGMKQPVDFQRCYALSTIGFDSVINSRLGVLPEHALDLAIILHDQTLPPEPYSEGVYSSPLLKIILDAYLWLDSPQDYAIHVFMVCAGATQHSLCREAE